MHIRSTRTRQHRPVTGLVLAAIAIFVTWSRDFGAIGRVLNRLLHAAIGQGGTELLAITLCLCGTVCALPPGTLVRAVTKIVELLAHGIVFLLEALTPAPEAQVVARGPAKVLSLRPAPPALPPAHRMRLDDVRGALKQLGYKPSEFEHIVAKMDGTQPIEVLVRSALVQLRKAAVIT